jgi:hypothetical protein
MIAVDTTPTSRVVEPEASIRGSAHDVRLTVDTTPTSRVATPGPSEGRSAHDVGLTVDTTPTSRIDVSTAPATPPATNTHPVASDQQQQ